MISKPVCLQQSEFSNSHEQTTGLFSEKEIFDRHYERVYRIAFRMTRSASEAQDITQEVFLKVFVKLDSFNNSSSLETWIFRIAVNTALDQLRWYKRFTKREVRSENLDLHADTGATSNQQLSGSMLTALAKVKPKNRVVIILRDIEGFSYREISDILDISSGTVASRLNRGYGEMRNYLSAHTPIANNAKGGE